MHLSAVGIGNFEWHLISRQASRLQGLGKVLTIGNQTDYRLFRNNSNHNKSIKNILLDNQLAESVDILDASAYQEANLIADLNLPYSGPEKFNTLIDSGTIEHVFDIKRCLFNYISFLNPGGHLIVATTSNNLTGHGFYQFSPEFFYSALSFSELFENIECYVFEIPISLSYAHPRSWLVRDPASLNQRINISTFNPLGIAVVAKRTSVDMVEYHNYNPQQSDYIKIWKDFENSPAASAGSSLMSKAKNVIKSKLRKMLPKMMIRKYGAFRVRQESLLTNKKIFIPYRYSISKE